MICAVRSARRGAIESIHRWPAILARYEAAPLRRERESYLLHLQELGTNRRRLRVVSAMLLQVVRVLGLTEARPVSYEEVSLAGDAWAIDQSAHAPPRPGPNSKRNFEGAARQFLRSCLLLIEAKPSRNHFDHVLEAFVSHLSVDRQLSSATVATAKSHMRRFLAWLAERSKSLMAVTPYDVEQYLSFKQSTCNPRSLAAEARMLMDFFAYAEQKALCTGVIKRSIVAPSNSRSSYERKCLSWENARLLSDTIRGGKPSDLRAKAVILLCSIYGLRSSEVAGLQLDSFQWESGTFSLRRAKKGRVQAYPIQYEVGVAIAAYLRSGRPQSLRRDLFLSIAVPYRPMTPTIVSHVVSSRVARLGIDVSAKGPHALRHACATQLLKSGSSLREIADFLGHRNLRTVSRYVRHDAAALREVADFPMLGEK